MKKLKLSREVRIGIMTVVAIFILYFGLNFLKGVDIFSAVNNYYATYDDIGGLVPSSPVYVKGYKVGQVEAVGYDFTKETSFVVKLSVSRDIEIPRGATVELYDDGLMGGKAIRLVYDPYSATQVMYAPGDTIPSAVSSGLMGQLAGDLLPKIESMAFQADTLLKSVRVLIEGDAVANSLASIEKTTADLAVSSAALKKIMQHDMPGILSNVNSVTSDFKMISGNLKQIDFASVVNNADLTIRDLNRITRKINEGEGSLGLLLNDKELYFRLSGVAGSADSLLIDLKSNPRRYVHFSLFGSGAK